MASSVRMMLVVKRGLVANATLSSNGTETATDMIINDLLFANSKSVRTSTIILASFNVLAAFGTAVSILYDCYWASKRCNPKFKASKFCVSSIHPAETLPLILAIGIVIQGLVFAAVQGQGMKMLFTDAGCDIIAQYMFPALFIVPFIQVVFGLECALRSVRKIPFEGRGKYDVTICGCVIFAMLIGTWVPTFVNKEPAQCFASLVWFVSAFGTLGFLMLSILAGLMIISAITIFSRLSTVTMVDQHQRIAASRMVYYLVLGIMSLALVIPYFAFQSVTGKGELKTAMMATVVLNLSGLMNGLLHLFLRSNTSTTSFGPKHGRHWAPDKHEIRLWGPNELAFTNHLADPVSGPRSPDSFSSEMVRSESQTNLVGVEKISMDSIFSPPFDAPGTKSSPSPSTAQMKKLPALNEASKESERSSKYHSRKQSYSLFPIEATKSPSRPNDTMVSIYDIADLAPPPKIQFGGKSHKRDSSVVSSATVQIGLRLSHAPDCEPESTLPLPSTTYNPKNFSTISKNSLLLPIAYGPPMPKAKANNATTLSPATFTVPSKKPVDNVTTLSPATFTVPSPKIPRPTPPLQLVTSVTNEPRPQTPEFLLRSPQRHVPTPLITTAISTRPTQSPANDNSPSVNKDLPPTPRAQLNPLVEAMRVSNTKLTPAVYSPSNAIEKSEKKFESTMIAGLPSSPRCGKDKTPGSAGLGSPSTLRNGSPTTFPSPNRADGKQETRDWI